MSALLTDFNYSHSLQSADISVEQNWCIGERLFNETNFDTL